MLGRFSSALQNAVDVLAPPPPLHEDFAYHWKRLMKNYLDITNSKNIPVELTNIPARLDELLKILIKEDDQTWETGRPGPCLEYLLQHNLLDLLATLATSDEPAGLKHYVLQFVSKFLTGMKCQVVGHQSVFLPLHRLVGLCDGTSPGPAETQEAQFLLGLAAVVRRNPQLVPVFTANSNGSCATSPRSKRRSSCGSSETSCISSSCLSDISTAGSTTPQNNPLFTPFVTSVRSKLIRLIPPPVSPESCVNESLSSSSSDDNKSIVVDDSAQFPLLDAALSYVQSPDSSVKVKACQIVMLLVSLPDVRAAEIIVSDTLFPSKMTSRLHDLFQDIPITTDPGLVDDMHISWGLDMASPECLTIPGTRPLSSFLAWLDFYDQVMAEAHPAIGQALARDLKDRFLDDIFDVDALRQPLNLVVLAKCFRMCNSPLMVRALGEWLVGVLCEKETVGSRCDKIYHRLLENWSSGQDDIILETVGLFEAILDKGDLHVIHYLLLNYVDDGSFLDLDLNDTDITGETNDNMTRIERIINSFVNIVPVGLRSSETTGYEQYIAESQRQYKIVCSSLNNMTPPGFAPVKSTLQSSRRDLFYEGPFLRTLFNSVANLPNQSYEVNLELTGIVSKVCLRPEPLLSKYMLETTVEKIVPEANTLHSVLHRVSIELASRLIAIPDYETHLKETRFRLISDQSPALDLKHPNQRDFENVVVVEELCKELAAIAFVKHKQRVSEL